MPEAVTAVALAVDAAPRAPKRDTGAEPLLNDQAYERIKRDVIACVLPPGSSISESQLGGQYRLGKAPIRMALQRLAHEGLVRALPRRGYVVSPVTLQDIQDIFELRLLLEPQAARQAAGKVDASRLKLLDDVCRAGYRPGDVVGTQRFLEANASFHVTIAQATGNQRLAHLIEALLDEMTRLLHMGLTSRDRSSEMQHEHGALVKALRRGDGDTAALICREQIEAARTMVLHAALNSRAMLTMAIPTADLG
ncbi:MAG: GntR family transcriptional regulator [Proteobacteria bacterium]|nr:GntR family transcriptional regulator [Burkholderiales bacterium]